MSALVSFASRVLPSTRGLHYGVPLASSAVAHASGELKPSYVPRPPAKGRALDKVEVPQKLKDKYFVKIGILILKFLFHDLVYINYLVYFNFYIGLSYIFYY